ncbi:Hypothetical predicted protein [Podarcis lilfordi]|uniref:Uncharacterized protein n=1 Tax=Podarcis lilfordi TaxID=74358 RepID=A0AA35K471_9SAUR|nr:Hypothetical predicted protein [Podarcis lilfordi]
MTVMESVSTKQNSGFQKRTNLTKKNIGRIPIFRKKNAKMEEECVAFLGRSENGDEFFPSILPDPDRYTDSDQEADPESHWGGPGMDKRHSGGSTSAVETAPRGKKTMQRGLVCNDRERPFPCGR